MCDEMKTVLITGAGSGLGFELTRVYARMGWRVFALQIRIRDGLLNLETEFQPNIRVIQCDIGNTEQVNAAIRQVRMETDHIDLLYNNAGFDLPADKVPLDQVDLDFCVRFYDVNAVGPLRVVKAAADLLKEGSMVVDISSEAGSLAIQRGEISYGYCMSKAAMNMGARIMGNWLRRRGVRTLLIHPGRMKSGLRGPHSNIECSESAAGIIDLLNRLDDMPYEWDFYDYRGIPYPW